MKMNKKELLKNAFMIFATVAIVSSNIQKPGTPIGVILLQDIIISITLGFAIYVTQYTENHFSYVTSSIINTLIAIGTFTIIMH